MATKAALKKTKTFDRMSEKVDKTAGLISSVLVIIGVVTGAIGWVNAQLQDAIAAQVSDLKATVQANDDQQNLAIMRLELMSLIQNDPDNTVEIEMLGKKYFQQGGDSYMSSVYSKYAKEHDLDTSFIVH